MERVRRTVSNRRRLSFLLSLLTAFATCASLRFFARTGWPLVNADWRLVLAGAVSLTVGQMLRTFAWQRLLPQKERPDRRTLFTVCCAATAASHLLPVRLDLAVKVGLLHRLRRGLHLQAIAVSLASVALLDNAAMLPLALSAFVLAPAGSLTLFAGLLCLASASSLPVAVLAPRAVARLSGSVRLRPLAKVAAAVDHNLVRNADGRIALGLLCGCWLARFSSAYSVLGAVGISAPLPRALMLTALAPLASIVPSPSGMTTSVGASAAILAACGVGSHAIVSFAISYSVLSLLVSLACTTIGASALVVAQPERRQPLAQLKLKLSLAAAFR